MRRNLMRDRWIITVMHLFDELPSQLRPFIRDGRISAIPAKRAPRLLLLDLVAQAFEPGRRYLVDEDLLSRTPDGTYWRSGGTVPVSSP